jgi:predicted secreted protein
LLYSPTPVTVSSTPSQPGTTTGQPDRQARADALFAALLADALRQIQEEQETQVRTLRYQYEDGLPSGEAPVMLWTAPPPTTDLGRDAGHPTLIQL